MRPDRSIALLALSALMILEGTFMRLPAQRTDTRQGGQRFMEFCAGCHGADGRGGDKAPSLVSGRTVRSDAELIQIVHDGTIRGMPPFAQIGDANIAAVVQYLRALKDDFVPSRPETSLTGNAEAGQALFFGKAQCSTCHLMQGKGGFIATGLTAYARDRTPDAIRHAIINPDDPLVPASRVVSVTTSGGQNLKGVLRNEDNFTMVLQTADGRYHFFDRSDLKDVQYTEHSLMPPDYAKRLKPEELDDIVSYMIVASRAMRTESAQPR